MPRFAFATALLPLIARAEYPSELLWDNSNAATLEFCQSGSSTYGYRIPGDDSPCGSKPGPLIRMVPGNTYKLTLQNTASDSALKTNIHTHGLHTVGDGDGDNVLRFVEGGSCLDYTWDIPSDHPGGTNWYHPHYHTVTNAQVSGGAFGLLVIEDNEDNYSHLAAWAHRENEKLLQIASSPSLGANGNDLEVIRMEQDGWYRLRVSVVTPGARASNVVFGGSVCTIYKVASDGVWHTAAFDAYPGSSFELSGASRADFAVKCGSGTTDIKWGNAKVAEIQAGSFGLSTGMVGDVNDLGSAPSRPYSLSNIDNVSINYGNTFAIRMSGAKINGAAWDPNASLAEIPYDEVHEWTISGAGAHPFHLHLYHMLVVGQDCGAHKVGEFYDTIAASPCTVRFKTADIGQMMILHCHVLGHEDNGAINKIDVIGVPLANQNNVIANSYTCSAGGSPPATPEPTSAPTVSPTPNPTDIPPGPPTDDCAQGRSTCLGPADCCSNNCQQGSCKGNGRFLRAQK